MTEQEIKELATFATTLTKDQWVTFITGLTNNQQTALANYVRPFAQAKLQSEIDALANVVARSTKLSDKLRNIGF